MGFMSDSLVFPLYFCGIVITDMAKRIYQIRGQYDSNSEKVIFSTTRKREVEREFNRIVRDCRRERDKYVEQVRIGYVKVHLSLSVQSYWICVVDAS